MPVRTVKIGYAARQGRERKDSADSKTSQNSGKANVFETTIQPFPAPKIPPLGKNHLPNVPPAR
jgi:hypothetical protein